MFRYLYWVAVKDVLDVSKTNPADRVVNKAIDQAVEVEVRSRINLLPKRY